MLFTYNIRPGEFGMFIGYGTKDEFNIDAQVEHFLDLAGRKGIHPDVVVIVGGHHDRPTGLKMFPALCRFATERLGRFTPPGYSPACGTAHVTPLCAVRGPGPLPALGPADLLRLVPGVSPRP